MALGSGFHMIFEVEEIQEVVPDGFGAPWDDVIGSCDMTVSTYGEEKMELRIGGKRYLVKWEDLAAVVRAAGRY